MLNFCMILDFKYSFFVKMPFIARSELKKGEKKTFDHLQ